MRWILLISLVLLPALSAQGADTIHQLRVQGAQSAADNKIDEAYELYRDAALIALNQRRPGLQVRCMLDMADLADFREEADWDDGAKLAKRAEELANQLGRRDLQLMVAKKMAWVDFGEESTLKREFDLCIANHDLESLAQLIDDFRWEDGWGDYVANAVKANDQFVEARLVASSKTGRDAAMGLATAADKISKLGFSVSATVLLEDAVKHDESIAKVLKQIYEKTGNLRGQVLCRIILTEVPEGEGRDTSVESLEECFRNAQHMRDYELQLMAAERLHKVTGDSYWKEAAQHVRIAEKFDLIADAERMMTLVGYDDPTLLERLKKFEGDPEVDDWIARIQPGTHYTEAPDFADQFRKALTDEKTMRAAITVAEIGLRHEAFPVIVKTLKNSGENPIELAYGIETLAQRNDRPTLLKLLAHADLKVQEAAAAALFRLGVDGIEPDIRAALAKLEKAETGELKTPHRVYLAGGLARLGDESALAKVNEMARRREEVEYFAFADSVLASLGYIRPMENLRIDLVNNDSSHHLLRAMGRMPTSWGQTDVTMWKMGEGKYHAARVWGLRGSPARRQFINRQDPFALVWAMPNRFDKHKTWNDFSINDAVTKIEDPQAREMLDWSAESGGLYTNSFNPPKPAEDDEGEGLPALRRMIELEKKYRNTPRGVGEQRLILFDWHGANQYARAYIRGQVGVAEFEDMSKMRIPYHWDWERIVHAGGLLGGLYKGPILEIAMMDLLSRIEIVIPGHGTVEGTYHGPSGGDKWGSIHAELPIIIGEGLGDDRPIPLETLRQGKIVITYDFNGNIGTMEFPLRTDVPPDAEKPDLVPVKITLDPAVPGIGESSRIFVKVKNKGLSVRKDSLGIVRFMVHNPQSGEGYYVLDAQVFVANGWRSGEVRTYEVRPKFVEDYYMNQFSYTYTPALGDSKIVVWVDPENSVEEADDDNNQIELEVPLRRTEKEGVRLAEAEAAEALAGMTGDLASAETIEDLDAAYDRLADVIDRLKVKTPAIRFLSESLWRSYRFRRGKIRAAEAMRQFRDAKEDGSLTKTEAIQIRNSLLRAKNEILSAGTPIEIETLEKSRNATLVAANTTASASTLEDLLYHGGVLPDNNSGASEASRLLKGYDAIKLIHIEAERMRQTGDLDTGNVLDVISNTADAIGAKLPFMNSMTKAMLKGELEYTQTGFQKTTNALEEFNKLIAGEGKEEDLQAAVRDVEKHFTTSPISEDDIETANTKSIPVLGELYDIYVSWK